MDYDIRLKQSDKTIYFKKYLEYVPECFIYQDEVYIVNFRWSNVIDAQLSTPLSISLDDKDLIKN